MQSSVRCPWSLWNSRYLVLSLLVGSVLIWDGHLRNFICCTSRKTCDTVAVMGSLLGDLSRFLCLLGLRSRCLSVLLFSLWVEELPFLDVRVSSLLMYFFALASTSAMFARGFFEMENIKSFYCTPNPTMNAVIANFSSGKSTFKDSALNLWT